MEIESLQREVAKLNVEKAALKVKSKLFENFAVMAHSCCRIPSAVEWDVLKETLQRTLVFAIEFTGAGNGSLMLLDSQGVVTDIIVPQHVDPHKTRSERIGCLLEAGIEEWVSRQHQAGVVDDCAKDTRCPAAYHNSPDICSMLAVPVLKCDEVLGVLTLTHPEPGKFSPEAVEQVQATVDQIALTLENTRLYAKLDESYRSLEKSKRVVDAYSKALNEELEKGRQIQRDFLPDKIPQLPNWDIATYFSPAKQVSGDFYDVFALPGNNIGIVIGDVCDKGIGSALYMALTRSLIRVFSGHISLHGFSNYSTGNRTANGGGAPAATLDQTNALNAVKLTNDYIAHEHGQEGMFATLFFGVMNPVNGVMAYINGGHESLLILDSQGVNQHLVPTGPAVGMAPDMNFDIQQVRLNPGQLLFGYTDGITEALSATGEWFTRERLISLSEQPPFSATELVERVKSNLLSFIGNSPLTDDITMLALQRLE